MKQTKEECMDNPTLLDLYFDYCQNLLLSKIPLQENSLYETIVGNVFGIHIHNMWTDN